MDRVRVTEAPHFDDRTCKLVEVLQDIRRQQIENYLRYCIRLQGRIALIHSPIISFCCEGSSTFGRTPHAYSCQI